MKFILQNPTEEQLNEIKKLGLPVVYISDTEIHFEVLEISEEDLPSGVVDLGLSVKWASCNIGADKPCDYGLLFQWGRVDGYAYGDTNNQFRTAAQNTADTGNKYIPATTSGKTYDAGDVLDSVDDAAYVTTNGAMRMPTAAEIDELLEGTTKTWCQCTVLGDDHTSHTVSGRLFTSKTDDSKKIFIPAAGSFSDYSSSFISAGSYGCVWSSSVYSGDDCYANGLNFSNRDCGCNNGHRDCGLSVRGVCE